MKRRSPLPLGEHGQWMRGRRCVITPYDHGNPIVQTSYRADVSEESDEDGVDIPDPRKWVDL